MTARLAPLLLFAVLAAAFLVGLNRDDARELPSVFLDKPAPALPTAPLAGFPAPTDGALTAPGLKLVNFWASWCPPCRAEHPTLLDLKTDGWTIIGVNKSDTAAQASAFLAELDNPFAAIATDDTGRRSIDWGVYGLPETFLIDEKGHIRLRHPGPVTRRVWDTRFAPVIAALNAAS